MEPWPSSIVILSAHIYLSSWTFAARCVTSSHASKGVEGGPLNFPLHCALYTPHFTLRTLHSKLTRHTLHPHSTVYTKLLTYVLYTPQFALQILHSTLYTPRSTLYTLHFTLYTWHSTLYFYTWHSHFKVYAFTLSTVHLTLDPHNFALFSLDAVWNLGLAPFSCCVRTSTCRRKLSPRTAWRLPALPKVHSGAAGGPLNFLDSVVMILSMLNVFIRSYTLHSTFDMLHLT